MKRIQTVLVANRGEIAVRVIRGIHAMGLRAVAIFSEADAAALHVQMADAAYPVGPAPSADSYLRIDRIIKAAQEAGAQAIHPGYGFLAENADFAQACADAGLIFIGPSPEAILLMGNKRAAKLRMIEAGVPCVPGYEGAEQDDATLLAQARKIGLPLMIKAAAGGGGRGMRLCTDDAQLEELLRAARTEAQNAFGSGEIILEKAVLGARHVEVQVFGDSQGQVVHLFERDCSVQRRHQKVVEESPSPAVDEALRSRMGDAAVQAAAAIGYVGAGTVEFLLGADGEFYFLEMNTRLQVEHPVTEMVTGQDLVEWQLRIADGEPLPHRQAELNQNGHAIEVRLCAEDPTQDYLPQTGPVLRWDLPELPGVRVDHGLRTGAEISPFYDSMVAKIIAHGADRPAAIRRLRQGLRQLRLHGVQTNQDYLDAILAEADFAAGDFHTGYVASHFPSSALEQWAPQALDVAVAAMVVYWDDAWNLQQGSDFSSDSAAWSSSNAVPQTLLLKQGDREYSVSVLHLGDKRCQVQVNDETLELGAAECDGHVRHLIWRNVKVRATYTRDHDTIWLSFADRNWCFEDLTYAPEKPPAPGSDGRICAHSDGKVTRVRVSVGERVQPGQAIVSLEAMKMEFQLQTPVAATVAEVFVEEGQQVANRQLLVRLDPDAD